MNGIHRSAAAALVLVLAGGTHAAGNASGMPARDPTAEKGTGPPQQDRGVRAEPGAETPAPQGGEAEPRESGSGVGAPAAPATPGTETATEASVPRAAAPSSPGREDRPLQLVGTIGRIDPATRAIDVASSSVRLQLLPGARVTRDGLPATLPQLRPGDRFRATYSAVGGAVRVRVVEASSAREPALRE